MPVTDVQLANLALIKLGEQVAQVTAVDGTDTSKYGRLMSPLYQVTREEELRSYKWQFATRRIQVQQAQVTTGATWTAGSAVMTVGTTTGMLAGWLVSTILIQGGGTVSYPLGIPFGTTIQSITDATHLVMSAAATSGGSGQLVFQVNNLTGYWFAYVAPANILRGGSVYAVFPNYTFIWPYKIQNIVEFGFIYEAGYIYTNLDPGSGNPIFQIIFDPGVAFYPSDFVEALSCRLAMKLCRAATKDEQIFQQLSSEYLMVITRAQGNNNIEHTEEEQGSTWWTDRGR